MSLTGFSRIGEITLPSITGSHSNFALLLRWADFHADVLSKLDNGGGDLRFSSDVPGSNQLPCHVITLDKVGSSAEVVVLIPTAATGQTIQVWGDKTGESQPAVTDPFGRNATYAQDENLYRLNTNPASGSSDLTGNHGDITVTNGSFTLDDSSWYATGTNDRAGLGYTGVTPTAYTMCAEIYTVARGNYGPTFALSESGGWSEAGYFHGSSGGTVYAGVNVATRIVSPSNTQKTGQWQWYQLVYNSGNISLYVDGSLVTSKSSATAGAIDGFEISNYDSNAGGIDAKFRNVGYRLSAKSTDHIATEYQNQSAVGAWVTMAPVAAGASIDANATLGTISYTSQNPTVLLSGSVDVTATLGAINYSSQPATVQLTGDIDVNPTLGTITYNSYNATVQLAGEINATSTLGQISYASNNTTVNLDGGITANAALGQINYTSQSATVTLQGTIQASTTLGAIVYNSSNSIVQIGEGQKITIVTAGFKPSSITTQFKPESITATFRTN